jgi:hypothetical protein
VKESGKTLNNKFNIIRDMTQEEFNEKYKDYIEDRFDGLSFGDSEFVTWLDGKFQEFIKKPGFNFAQIKSKYGWGRFYCNGLGRDEVAEVEQRITKICKSA